MKRVKFIFFLYILSCVIAFTETIEIEIVRGDTLYSISRKYDVSVDQIMSWNNLDSANDLQLGKKIKIIVESNETNDTINYIVTRGDTFYRIAREHGLSVDHLLRLNNLTENHILREGDILIVNDSNHANISQQNDLGLTESNLERVSYVSDYQSLRGDWPINGNIGHNDTFQGWVISVESSDSSKSVSHGKVVWSGAFRDYGNVVIVDSNDLLYFYGGNGNVLVTVGESVSIGTELLNGLSVGQLVYFSIYKGSKPIDYYNGVER